MTPPDSDTPGILPPACGPTAARIQAVLDGDAPAGVLNADPHAATCAACRERVGAARLLLVALARPAEPVAVPAGLTGAILAGVRADRRARTRRRAFVLAGGLAAAAAVVVAAWVMSRTPTAPEVAVPLPPPSPHIDTQPAPGPPLRLNDELAKAGDALRDTSRTLTEPAAVAPKVVAALADGFMPPLAAPLPADMEPVRQSLADLPDAVQDGLEPVTGSARKAFSRLLRDVSTVPPAKPKS